MHCFVDDATVDKKPSILVLSKETAEIHFTYPLPDCCFIHRLSAAIMQYPPADKRRVYLACRAIFAGNDAQLRKQKKIRELVGRHRSLLGPLLSDFGADKVHEILRVLLEGQIFQSELKAKVEFPELFVSSPVRDEQRAASENDAARSAAEALEEIESLEGRDEEVDIEEGRQPERIPRAADPATSKR